MRETKSIIVCGVGGQGSVLASDIIANALFYSDLDVKKCEIHGMSQRQGSVVGFVKYGDKVYSPVVGKNEADFLVSFEKLESLRYISLLKNSSIAIVSNAKIQPISVIYGLEKYPENIEEYLKKKTSKLIFIDPDEEIKTFGNPKAINVYMLGILSNFLTEVKYENWIMAIENTVKKNFVDINIKAFNSGREKDL
ncbi:MAG: indolepyruvate oxidoreductase subunit beta [Brevinematia bacterium]